MKKDGRMLLRRLMAFFLILLLTAGYIPARASADTTAPTEIPMLSPSDAPETDEALTPAEAKIFLSGTVTLTGTAAEGLNAGEFAFEIVDENGSTAAEAVNGADGSLAFSPLVYTPDMLAEGETEKLFSYTVREKIPAAGDPAGNMTYDSREYAVTVQVTLDALTGMPDARILSVNGAEVNGGSYDGLNFTNIQNPNPISYRLPVQEKAGSENLPEALGYSFRITDLAGNDLGASPMDYDHRAIGNTYFYRIEEAAVDGGGETVCATPPYVLAVTVGLSAHGILTADPVYYTIPEGVTAEDLLTLETAPEKAGEMLVKPEPVTAELSARVEMGGEQPEEDLLSFELTGMGDTFPDIGHDEGGDLLIPHEALRFSAPGAYIFTLRETQPSETSDSGAAYTVLIAVSHDGEGQLTAETHYYQTGETGILEAVEEAVFTGSQPTQTEPPADDVSDPEPAKLTLTVTKTLTGRTPAEGEFTFQLLQKDSEGQYTTIVDSASNQSDGTVTFLLEFFGSDMAQEAGFSAEKTFCYQIREQIPEDAVNGVKEGVAYTSDAIELEVVVKEENGVLKTFIGGEETDMAFLGTFTNVYTPADAQIVLKAETVLTGMEPAADAFTFELVDSQGQVIATAKNAADGSITFEKLTYTQEMLENAVSGDFVYTIRQKTGNGEGMTYDPAVYTATVSVTDDQKGALSASVTYSPDAPVFRNAYTAPIEKTEGTEENVPAAVVIAAEKVLTGKTLEANAFAFELVNADNHTYSAGNDSSGSVSFFMEYTEAGTYVYTMREKLGMEAGIAYDTNIYRVTVTVAETEDGTLSASVVYGTDDGKAPVFRSSYTAPPAAVTLTGTKVLNGRAMKAGEFRFQVKDPTGAPVATGTNDAEGNITFSAVTLPAAGRYVLTVTEVNTGAWLMTYDSRSFTVTVDVVQTEGILQACVTYPEGGIRFVNTYKYNSSATPGTGDSTPLPWLIALMVLSGTALTLLPAVFLGKRRKGKE